MSRPKKSTVDYFPHDTQHKTTIPIIEARWGNDGYAFFFKMLEMLGTSDNHFIDAGNPVIWEFLLAKTRLDEVTATAILDLLAKLQAIDAELWRTHKVIYSQNFVDRISDAYRKRIDQKPTREKVSCLVSGGKNSTASEFPAEETPVVCVIPAEETGKVKESKVKKEKYKKEKMIPPEIEEVRFYCRERGNGVDADRWFNYYAAKGWMVGKAKMVDWQAAVRTWERSQQDTQQDKEAGFLAYAESMRRAAQA